MNLKPTHLHVFLRKRPLRITFVALSIALFLFAIFGYAILPRIIQSQAEAKLSETLQRKVKIGDVAVDPFALTVTMRDFRVMDAQRKAVFASFDTLAINLSAESLFRLAPVVQEIRLTKPSLHLIRSSANHYNFDDILAALEKLPHSEEPARFSINNIQVEQGSIRFDDRPAKATHTVSGLTLGIPFLSSLPSQVQIFVEPLLKADINGTPLLIKGKARPFAEPKEAVVEFDTDGFDMTRLIDYLPLNPQVSIPSARLDMRMTASFRQAKDKSPSLIINGKAALTPLEVREPNGKQALVLPSLSVELKDLDAFDRHIDIDRIVVEGLEANIERDRKGQWNVQQWFAARANASGSARTDNRTAAPVIGLNALEIRKARVRFVDAYASQRTHAGVEHLDLDVGKLAIDLQKKNISIGEVNSNEAAFSLRHGTPAKSAAPEYVAPAERPVQAGGGGTHKEVNTEDGYVVNVGKIAIANWSARLEDNSRSQPSVTSIAPLSLTVHNLSSGSSAPALVELKAGVNKTGRLAVKGQVGVAPFGSDLAVDMSDVDILPLQPYFGDKINVKLTRASLSGNGKLQLNTAKDKSLQGGFKGNLALGNVDMVDNVDNSAFLRWKTLSFNGVDARLEPLALTVDQVTLGDFFARVVIEPDGRFNLQDIVRGPAVKPNSAKTTENTSPNAGSSASSGSAGSRKPAVNADNATNADSAGSAAASAMPPIRIGKLSLQKGRVRFTDNFIRPHYTARLSDLGGVVTGLSSDAASSANVDLQGEVNGAPLSIAGRINPLRKDLLLDLKANVRGMELAPLSPYSGRYIGYGIEKGKLSFEASYQVENRQLTAQNRVILDQLTFGDRIENSSATDLPVRFAVALMRDRNGVIDINLPIAGSLNDPQFSIGGVLFKAFGNLIAKAVTQPFALLGAMFGSEEAISSSLELEPGRAAVPPAGENKLKALAKALADRPALRLDIAGRADPQADIAGLKRVAVERKLRALKQKDVLARGEPVEPGSITVRPDEYGALLTRAYRDEKFPKPRNVLGLPKDLSVEEMQKLMETNADVDQDDLIALANQRALAVKTWLMKNGQVPADRVFIVASKIGGGNADEKDAGGTAHRVDFSLR